MQEDFRKAIEKIIEILELEKKIVLKALDDDFEASVNKNVKHKKTMTPAEFAYESGRILEIDRLLEALKQVAIAPSIEEALNNIISYNKEDN